MSLSHIELGRIRSVLGRATHLRRQRQEMASKVETDPSGHPEYAGADLAPRPTPRQQAFDNGQPPLPPGGSREVWWWR